jgi:hypothetical protein
MPTVNQIVQIFAFSLFDILKCVRRHVFLIAAMILLMFWCEMMNNCPRPRSFDPWSTTTTTYNWSSHIILHFKHSNRYLCINERGHVYSRRPVSVMIIVYRNAYTISFHHSSLQNASNWHRTNKTHR